MGITFSLVAYAERIQESNQWELKNEVVMGAVSHWLVHQVERMQGRGQFVFLSETRIEVDDEESLNTLSCYIERVGYLDVFIAPSPGP
jgi:hypothetical protein